jgi:MFS family permease/DNA-binding MarR family transcriptional regulator
VVLASLLMLGGSAADRLGRARVFKLGLALFTLASLACSLAPGVGWLIAFRVVQGSAGAMLNPVAMSIIRNTFEDPRERAQAIGIWAAVVGISMALGPVLGGVLVALSWRAVFLVNIPIGVAAIALTVRFVPESRAPRPRRPDPIGQVLVIAMLASLTSAIIEGPSLGWGSRAIVALAATAAVALVTLVRYELCRVDPLIEPRFFASRPFAAATVIAVAAFTAFGGFLFLNTLYLQDVRGLSPASAGLYTLPMAAMTMVCGPIAGRVVGARGVRGPAGRRRPRAGPRQPDARVTERRHVPRLGVGRVLRLRARVRRRESADHEHRRLRHAAEPGRRGGRSGHHQPPGGTHARRRRGGRGGHRQGGRLAPRPSGDRQPRGVVADRRPGSRDRGARPGRGHRGGRGQCPADRGAAGGVMAPADADLPRRAWRVMSDVVLDHDRKIAVSEALGLSWARVLALRRLAAQPLTQRALAERLAADPPYVTLMVDDLEERGLVRRMPHPEDRRAKLVELTRSGRAAAARADAILDEPPAALRDVPAEDLAAVLRVLERLAG